ncbi:hypothetical protein CDAR_479511 [Caerostris darwini]|uniref:Uncharacterized protein n=1 Tax=Caerostris darwini TaxID=1538125 RepID=A0AAV4MVZ7_9ARAC|nr:hypothetical protein CDAR_479511 [Caerostris darwini]
MTAGERRHLSENSAVVGRPIQTTTDRQSNAKLRVDLLTWFCRASSRCFRCGFLLQPGETIHNEPKLFNKQVDICRASSHLTRFTDPMIISEYKMARYQITPIRKQNGCVYERNHDLKSLKRKKSESFSSYPSGVFANGNLRRSKPRCRSFAQQALGRTGR